MYQNKSRYNINYRHLIRLEDNFYVCNRNDYDYSLGLYDVELFYIINRICSYKFVIYEIIKLSNGKKIVYLRRYDDNMMFKIIIPKLKKIYIDVDRFNWKNVYLWKTRKGNRRVVTDYTLYNRNYKRYYKVGDINKYGHKLIKISEEQFYYDTKKELYQVGLNVNDRFIKL